MKRVFVLLIVIALAGFMSCQNTANYVNAVEAPEAEVAEVAVEAPEAEVAEVAVEAPEAEVAVEAEPEVAAFPLLEAWRIVHAEITWEGGMIASSNDIPIDYQELEYLVVASSFGNVGFLVSEHSVAWGTYWLDGNEIAVELKFLDWESVELVENYYGFKIERGFLDEYYFFVDSFDEENVTVKAYFEDLTLTFWAAR